MARMTVAGILLAAGSSTRMGRNKLLLRLEGESLLRRAARRALAAGLDPVLVVLGHEAERARAELAGLRCRAVSNPRHARGMGSSLAAGLRAVPGSCGAAVVLLADMPLVREEMIAAVVARWRETGAPLVLSRYGEVQAPPALYGRGLFAELAGGDGEGRGREVARRHRDRAALVDQPPEALADVDRLGDLARARARAGEERR
jgi:molybdenum cofactor cytidylyltransferase